MAKAGALEADLKKSDRIVWIVYNQECPNKVKLKSAKVQPSSGSGYLDLLNCTRTGPIAQGKYGLLECTVKCSDDPNGYSYTYSVCDKGGPLGDPELRVKGGRPGLGKCKSDDDSDNNCKN